MKNYYFNELLDQYDDQVDEILSDEEKTQRNTYIFYSVYEVGGLTDMGECCDGICYIIQCFALLFVVLCVSRCLCGTNDENAGNLEFCNFEKSCWGESLSCCQDEVDKAQDGLFGGSALCCNINYCCDTECCDGYLCDCCC